MSAPPEKAVADGPQYATVRPQDIVVGEDAQGLANEFRANVVAVSDEGFSVRVVLRPDGPDLVASLPKRPHCSCSLTVGEKVTVGFDAEALHLFSADEE